MALSTGGTCCGGSVEGFWGCGEGDGDGGLELAVLGSPVAGGALAGATVVDREREKRGSVIHWRTISIRLESVWTCFCSETGMWSRQRRI